MPSSSATTAVPPTIAAWHDLVADPEPDALRAMLSPRVRFCSPAVHTPQEGPEITFAYLWAAVHVLGPTLRYQHEWYDDRSAVLRFTARVDGLDVEGVDLVEWDDDGLVTDFTVMVRPFKGLQALIGAMAARLSGTP
ncbi:MAG: polyketide cyclase [Nocardioides sp.]|nr:polyketide cyclase [Nocardioides sp.]